MYMALLLVTASFSSRLNVLFGFRLCLYVYMKYAIFLYTEMRFLYLRKFVYIEFGGGGGGGGGRQLF